MNSKILLLILSYIVMLGACFMCGWASNDYWTDKQNKETSRTVILDQQIEEQKRQNELERLKTEQALIRSQGLTKEILQEEIIKKWDGKTPLNDEISQEIELIK